MLERNAELEGHRWIAVALGTDDAPALQAFLDANPLYAELAYGRPWSDTAGLEEITERPPADWPQGESRHWAVLERGTVFLGTVGNNAPFVGLLGTVIGVIAAFEELGHAAPGHGAGPGAASQIASQAVMSNIAEALVATAVGLLVALPAVAAYNYFQRKIAALCQGSEALTNIVLAYLADTSGPRGQEEEVR